MEKLNFEQFDQILLSYTSIETLLYNCFVTGEGTRHDGDCNTF